MLGKGKKRLRLERGRNRRCGINGKGSRGDGGKKGKLVGLNSLSGGGGVVGNEGIDTAQKGRRNRKVNREKRLRVGVHGEVRRERRR